MGMASPPDDPHATVTQFLSWVHDLHRESLTFILRVIPSSVVLLSALALILPRRPVPLYRGHAISKMSL
jgi:hypothetical protein